MCIISKTPDNFKCLSLDQKIDGTHYFVWKLAAKRLFSPNTQQPFIFTCNRKIQLSESGHKHSIQFSHFMQSQGAETEFYWHSVKVIWAETDEAPFNNLTHSYRSLWEGKVNPDSENVMQKFQVWTSFVKALLNIWPSFPHKPQRPGIINHNAQVYILQ